MASAEVCKQRSVGNLPDDTTATVKVAKSVSAGNVGNGKRKRTKSVTIITALHNKYSTSSMTSLHCVIFMAPNAPGKTESGSFRVPEILTLNSFNITSAGDCEELTKLCADVVELDLTENSISSWSEVFHIIDCMPKLEFLNLTKNPLEQLGPVEEHRYTHIKKVALNFTNLAWDSISNLLQVLPELEELYLSGNEYKGVLLDCLPYSSLRLLHLTSNKLSDWSDVQKLDKLFPNLVCLVLAYNDIASCGSEGENRVLFKNLTSLNMNNTLISDWDELDNLSCLASMKDIRLASIPLLEEFEDLKRRQLLSVYFPHVSVLNGSAMVNDSTTAERAFLRHFMDKEIKPNRYFKLEEKHGKLQPLASIDLKPKDTVAIRIECAEKSEIFDIPLKQTVGQLKRSLKTFVGTARFRMFYQTKYAISLEEISRPYIINRFLWALNFSDGDKIMCDILDEPTSPTKAKPASSGNVSLSPTKEPPNKKNNCKASG